MNIQDAAYLTVHDAPGGASALQVRLGKRNLSDEVNPNIKGAKLGLLDALKIQQLTGDHRIFMCMADELGYEVPVLREDEEQDAAGNLQACLLRHSAALLAVGNLTSQIADSLRDGVVDRNEMRQLSRVNAEFDAARAALNRALRANHAAYCQQHELVQEQPRPMDLRRA